jgi:hypothetical protein
MWMNDGEIKPIFFGSENDVFNLSAIENVAAEWTAKKPSIPFKGESCSDVLYFLQVL